MARLVSNNLISDSVEFGIDLLNSSGGVTIEQNTILNAGFLRNDDVLIGGAIGLSNQGNEVLDNEIVGNFATGILVRGTEVGNFSQLAASGNLISSNYFEANAGLDIDITRPDRYLVDRSMLEPAMEWTHSMASMMTRQATGLQETAGLITPCLTSSGTYAGNVLAIGGSYFEADLSMPQIELYLIGSKWEQSCYFATINPVADQTSFDSSNGRFYGRLRSLDEMGLPPGAFGRFRSSLRL